MRKCISTTADFRKYASVEDSVADHSAYLLGAMNGKKKRYAGLSGCTDYKKAIQIIKAGGYAISSDYVESICSIIRKYNLTRFDETTVKKKSYLVRVKIDDLNIRKGSGTTYAKVGKYTGKGIFTIVDEVVAGESKWGLLKSYEKNRDGWICLDYAEEC